jgi:two-component system CheB/CheR fusion protein
MKKPITEKKTALRTVSKPAKQRTSTSLSFPIVGIGASAGGLEALEQFFTNMPKDSGMAFVVIQHLDPDHTGILHELLQRTTGMKVSQEAYNLGANSYVVKPVDFDQFINAMSSLGLYWLLVNEPLK